MPAFGAQLGVTSSFRRGYGAQVPPATTPRDVASRTGAQARHPRGRWKVDRFWRAGRERGNSSVSGGRALNAIRRGRRTFVTLFLVCLGIAIGASFQGAGALEEAELQAQITAKGLANAGVASVLEPADVSGTIAGDAARDLLSRLQRGVLVDGTAFRVRVWSPAGDLLFSTDAGDASDAVSADLDAVYAATRGIGRI